MDDNAATIATLSAILALVGALVTAAFSRRHDRRQQARLLLFAPADSFCRAALAALAALRHVTPAHSPRHRNHLLVVGTAERQVRLGDCVDKLDVVRQERAGIPLAFGPSSPTAEQARRVLASLRRALEAAEAFYVLCDGSDHHDPASPTSDAALALRTLYKDWRSRTYDELALFYDEVATHMIKPDFDRRRFRPAGVSPTELDLDWTQDPHAAES